MPRLSETLARRPSTALWLIAGYFALAVVLRVLRSDGLQSDEAEQLFQSQFWLLGYGRQPPFYNWLQAGVIELIGPSILSLSLTKNLLLLLTVALYGRAARIVLKDLRFVAIAMLGVVGMPFVSVMAQRDLTHAVATLFATALFLCTFLRTLTRPTLASYALTGLAVGIGLISKYNFVIVPVAAILAILPERELRERIFDRRFLAALVVAAAVCLPHGLWVMSNLTDATAGTISAMREDATGNVFLDRLSGLWTLVLAVSAGALPVIGFFLIAFRRSLIGSASASNRWTRITGRMIVLSLVLVGLIGLGFGATTISEKWLSPFLLLLPLYLCLKLEAANKDASRALPRMLVPVSVLAIGFIIYIALGNLIGPRFGQYSKESLPAAAFLEQVLAEKDAKPAFIIAADPILAASARIAAPDAYVLLPGFSQAPKVQEGQRTGLIVWQGQGTPTVPESLGFFAAENGVDPATVDVGSLSVDYLNSRGDRKATFGYAWVKGSERASPPAPAAD